MGQFVWRLQRVLDVKAKEERFKQTELLRLTEQLAAKRTGLLMRQRILHGAMADIQGEPSARRVGAQELFLKYTAANDEQIRRLRTEIDTLEQERTRKTAEVLALKRFTEGLERLRERARERFVQERERLEQKALDDLTTNAFARNEAVGSHNRHEK